MNIRGIGPMWVVNPRLELMPYGSFLSTVSVILRVKDIGKRIKESLGRNITRQ